MKAHFLKISRLLVRRPGKRSARLLGAAGIVIVALLVVLIATKAVHSPAGPDGISQPIVHTEDNPSEVAVTSTYSVPAKQPLSIEIADNGIKGFIQKVGVDQHKDVTAPNNVNLAGWFVNSVLPGEKGLSIIDGHVDGRSERGVFHSLKDVKPGAEVVVMFGDKSIKKFSVFAVKSVQADKAVNSLFDQDPTVTSQLNIITCTGRYDNASQGYTERSIVSAKLMLE